MGASGSLRTLWGCPTARCSSHFSSWLGLAAASVMVNYRLYCWRSVYLPHQRLAVLHAKGRWPNSVVRRASWDSHSTFLQNHYTLRFTRSVQLWAGCGCSFVSAQPSSFMRIVPWGACHLVRDFHFHMPVVLRQAEGFWLLISRSLPTSPSNYSAVRLSFQWPSAHSAHWIRFGLNRCSSLGGSFWGSPVQVYLQQSTAWLCRWL